MNMGPHVSSSRNEDSFWVVPIQNLVQSWNHCRHDVGPKPTLREAKFPGSLPIGAAITNNRLGSFALIRLTGHHALGFRPNSVGSAKAADASDSL